MLAGPTGAGKTGLVTSLNPERFEVVSLDSRQIYRGLTIGTAAPDQEVLSHMTHHLVGFLDPDQTFTAAQYRLLAIQAIESIIQRRRIPLLVGGAGFYLELLRSGPFQIQEDLRIKDEIRSMSHEERLGKLESSDPHCIVSEGEQPSRGRIHRNDAYRVERYLTLVLSSGMTMAEIWAKKEASAQESPYDFQGWFLYPGEDTLWERLKLRAAQMVESGLLQEARDCRDSYGSDCPGLQILGYSEVLDCLDGKMDRWELEEKLWILHRQYARRQRIWFQKRKYVQFVDSLDAARLQSLCVNLFSGPRINH